VKYINEARGMGISILPPDVNESDLYFTPVGDSIRFGFAAIKNVGENTAKAIRDSRLGQGEFKSLYEFCERIESRFLNKRVFESLIKSGAMDSLGPREAMLASVDEAINAIQRAARAKESGQHGLFFGGAAAEPKVHFELRDAPPWSEEERLTSEYVMLGFYVSGHPLEKYASRLKDLGALSLDELEGQRNGKENHCRSADRWHAADAFEEGRSLGHFHDSGHDWCAGAAGVSGKFCTAGKYFEAGRAAAAESSGAD